MLFKDHCAQPVLLHELWDELSTLVEKYKNNLTSIVSDSQGRDRKDIKLYILL